VAIIILDIDIILPLLFRDIFDGTGSVLII
jgi:hypothetical protein